MDFPSTQVLDDNDSSSSRSSESLQKTPKRVYQVATLTVGNKKYPIFEGVNKVGRNLDNDICINDNNVSMYHAEIEADVKHAFICDLRSTNKTRMNDEKLKPDRFYQLLDGAKLTFGILNGIYLRLRDDESVIIPSTPEPGLKLRRGSNKNSSRPNISLTGDSDDSVILGTQEVPETVFVKPLVPNRTENIKDTSNNPKVKINESDESIYNEETQHTNKSIESQSFIHECATQKYDFKQSEDKKINTDNRQKSKIVVQKSNISPEESEIFDRETQKLDGKNNDIDESQIATQKSVNKRNKQIYDIETQKRNESDSQNRNNVYNMTTERFQPLNIRKEKTEIYDVETQHLTEKSDKFKNQNVSTKVLNGQEYGIVTESDEEHEQDNIHDTKNSMVLRSCNNGDETITTNKKVCINNNSNNNKFNNLSQKRLGSIINETTVETDQNSSTLKSKKSYLIVEETDDESETDDEGVFTHFLSKKDPKTLHNIYNTDSEVMNETDLNNEDSVSNEVHSSHRNCASPVLVNFNEISESVKVKNEDNIADDSDNEMYMTPNPIMSPMESDTHSDSAIAMNDFSRKKCSDSQMNSYNDEDATQRITSPTYTQTNEENQNIILEATQSMIATQILSSTKKNDIIGSENNSLKTQIADTQVHEINNYESPKKKQILKDETQLADTQILETQSIYELSECIDKSGNKKSVKSLRDFKKPNRLNKINNDTFYHKKMFDDNNDEENNKNFNNNDDSEPTQLIEFENNAMKENTLKEQETEINNDFDVNEKPLKTLKLKKKITSKNCEEWRISSSCGIDCNDESCHHKSLEMSKNENNGEISEKIHSIIDKNELLSVKKIDNNNKTKASQALVSASKKNLSLNQSTKNEFKNKNETNQEIQTSNHEDNDLVLKNLDNMFGEVASEDMVEPTQLLTQQLVDILKTPEKSDNLDTVVNNIDKFQKLGAQKNVKDAKKMKEGALLGNCFSADEESQELYFAQLNFKRKRQAILDTQDSSDSERTDKHQKNFLELKNNKPCLSGFIDGVAVVCKQSNFQEIKKTINFEETNNENDDILLGLPEVNLNGAGLSPSSDTSSPDSSDEDFQSNEKKVLVQLQATSKTSKNKKSVLSLQCDNKIKDNSDSSREQTKIATVRLTHYDNKEKSITNHKQHLKSDEETEIDEATKRKEEKAQIKISQLSKLKPNSEIIVSGFDSSSEPKEKKMSKKRTASCDMSQSLIESKKKRPIVKLDNSLNISMRQETKRKIYKIHKYVIFTGIDAENYIEPIKRLGGAITDEPSKATILVTDKVRRTYKFICAVSKSIPIVSIKWIDECIEKDELLDPDEYILKDEASEIKFDFELSESLKRSSKGLLLQGYTFIITPKIVNPSIKDLKDMIQVAGGKSLIRMPRVWVPNTVIIGCDADVPKIKEIVKKIPKNITVPVVTTECILCGILKQKLEPELHPLYK